jgi:8-oxo-dGTP pyrophosphatase MutT (NUDIX family)
MIKSFRQSLLPLDVHNKQQLELKCAAVLLPLVLQQESNQWEIILTRRAQHLKHHPGQISFPGGKFEITDINLSITAVRETYEEIGITPDKIELIGQLPQQKTTSQFNITPFVGIVKPEHHLKIDPNEVAEIFTVPLKYVLNKENQKKVTETINDIEYSYYTIQYQQYNIWGATARILVNLSRRLESNQQQK